MDSVDESERLLAFDAWQFDFRLEGDSGHLQMLRGGWCSTGASRQQHPSIARNAPFHHARMIARARGGCPASIPSR